MAKNLTQKSKKKELWQLVRESTSLSTPRGRLVSFGIVLIVLTITPTEKLYFLPIKSIYETFLGFVPYSSGMTRGVSSVLHGNFEAAFEFNPLSFVVLGIVLILVVTDAIKIINQFRKSR